MERLVQTDKNGNERFTDIRVTANSDGTATITKITGVVGSEKTIESHTPVSSGYDKAYTRAQTMWNNTKIKCTQILPMLANKWEDRHKYITEPFYVQPKLDGVRLIVSNKGCYSRTGKLIDGLEHLARNLKDGEYLDGECYAHDKTFEEITSLFKTKPKDLEFHVFDYFDVNRPNLTFEERKAYVNVDTFLVKNKSDVIGYHDMFVNRGYEGIMIRDARSVYEIGRRSNYLLKYKAFQTEEFTIIDAKEGGGREKGSVIWVCKVGEHTFSVKPQGTLEVRKTYWNDKYMYIGKKLIVRYQNLTELGIPRFPIGIAIRDYE
jgi:DNA ligase-1